MQKGFTLIELLAVIVILAIIALIAVPIVLNIIKDTKAAATLRSADFYIDALENEIALQNMKQGGNFNPNLCEIKTKDNVLGLYCDDKLINVKVDGEVPNEGSKITFEEGKVIDVNLKYPSGNVTLNDKGELVLGNSSNKSICILISGEPNAIGSKYQCKVKDDMEEGFENGYYFFVLSHNEDGTTNLIMERNMYYDEENDVGKVATDTNKGTVAWYAPADNNSFGPVTAIDYLHSATKDWDNVPKIIMNYEDENIDSGTQQKGLNGYGSIKTTDNITIITSKNNEETGKIENLKARMPRYDEVHGTGKCLTYAENGNKYGSCPLWLSNYLSSSVYVKVEGLQNISGIYGYWTLSSRGNYYNGVWYVDCNGFLNFDRVDYDGNRGVRPVITIEL